ncbi:MAG: efflux RND transporter periplasmic adaptor subunit [Armatimonadetes bacterium]|nr:efflux RND transporter periplasmic adaptor subunit [Armatimonadota bacterium]
MKPNRYVLLAIVLFAGFGGYWWIAKVRAKETNEVSYRTAEVERGSVVSSISATGVLQADLIVDVKSKAGGRIDSLLVDVGSEVEVGQLIAKIDPSDTESSYNQARADLDASHARVLQAKENLEIQKEQSEIAVKQAEAGLEAARARLRQAEERNKVQPKLSEAQLQQAEAAVQTARYNVEQLEKVTIPQSRKSAQTTFDSARTQYETSQRNYDRAQELLKKGYVSQQAVDNAEAQFESARSAYLTAEQRLKTIEDDLRVQSSNAKVRLKEAESGLDSAKANQIQIQLTEQSLKESQAALTQAEATLRQAKANLRQIQIRAADITSAKAQVARSEAGVYNAKVQLDSTTITAPRSGVVIKKFVEEGTIIPPGTSVFAQGTSIVQIADTSRMFVNVSVDEADIAAVEEEQIVDVTVDAYPDEIFEGKVTRIEPQAIVEQNVTVVYVRVEVINSDARLKPGMNASCEFIIKRKDDVIKAPNEAIKNSNEGKYVEVLVNGKPERKTVKTGISGNDSTEITEGVSEGEVVVTGVNQPVQATSQRQGQSSPLGGGGFGGGGRPRGFR